VITTADGSLSVLLGASPGASTAVSIMVDLITGVLRMKLKLLNGRKIKTHDSIIRTVDNPALLDEIRQNTATVLKLNN
jgi:malate dehydrogenase (quinone)